jgi:hypothetical protein
MASIMQMPHGSVAGMAGTGRAARLLSHDAVLVIVGAEPLALVFQKASLSHDDLLPACPPPLAHDGPLFRDSLLGRRDHTAPVIQRSGPGCTLAGHLADGT